MKITENIYRLTWRNKWITAHATSIDDFIETFENLAKEFRRWKELGIKLYTDRGIGDDYASFITDDMDIAIKAGFTFYMGDDRKREYLELLSGGEIEVPKEKLEKLRKKD
ncbi:MAG: hypothetical protein EAX91_01175 [Candidatus Lokiarchaeota archaeon]|nr:hypothetical protein [Candidatus Lokiarchaeota archaeon]